MERLDTLLHTSAQRLAFLPLCVQPAMWQHFLVAMPGYGSQPARNAPSADTDCRTVANMDDVSSVASGTGEDSHPAGKAPSGHILKRVSLMKFWPSLDHCLY